MEEAKTLNRGARAHTCSKVLIFIQILLLTSMIFQLFEDKQQAWVRFSENTSIALATLARFDLATLLVFVAGLIGFNALSIAGLLMAILAWHRYKNEKARPTVALAVGVIIATSLLDIASRDFFS